MAPASAELTTPANRTANATSAIAATASQVVFEASVAMQTNTAPVTASAAWARSRERIGPAKSTNRSIANEPKAAKVDSVGLPITTLPSANIAGITSAVRAARRSAFRLGSCRRNQFRSLADIRRFSSFGRGSASLPPVFSAHGWRR